MVHREIIDKKILDETSLQHALSLWRFKDLKVVFTNGCFDLLHLGHIDYLSKAADLGQVLIIGLNSDASVSVIKGPLRPINNQVSRATVLASLSFVTAIMIFNESTPGELIKKVRPSVLVKGADYKPEQIVGADFVKSYGGRVETIPLLEGYSTTGIENKILKNHSG